MFTRLFICKQQMQTLLYIQQHNECNAEPSGSENASITYTHGRDSTEDVNIVS
jgi:hypothetical protein